MKDDFEATLIVDLASAEVWEALTRRKVDGDDPDQPRAAHERAEVQEDPKDLGP